MDDSTLSARSASSGGSGSATTEAARAEEERSITAYEQQGLENFEASRRWFLSHQLELRRSHPGQFVAIQRGALIAAAPSFADVLARLAPDCDRGHLFNEYVLANDEDGTAEMLHAP